jgi:hypothetical protein
LIGFSNSRITRRTPGSVRDPPSSQPVYDAVHEAVLLLELRRLEALGNRSRVVVSITRAPANPILAFGSAITTSAAVAKEAVTPPKVGSARTETYGHGPIV